MAKIVENYDRDVNPQETENSDGAEEHISSDIGTTDGKNDEISAMKSKLGFWSWVKRRVIDISFVVALGLSLGLEIGLMDQSYSTCQIIDTCEVSSGALLDNNDISGSDSYIDSFNEEACSENFVEECSTNPWFESVQERFYINEIIIATCALTSTILSVSISLYSDTIHGLKLIRFRKLRTNENYNLVAMILIPIGILGSCVGLFYAHLWVTAIVLNVFALIYAIYFICKEVPILIQNEKVINKIIKDPINKRIDGDKSISNSSDETDNYLLTVLTDIVYNDGIQEALKTIGRNDIDALCYLLGVSTERTKKSKYGKLYSEPLIYRTHIENVLAFFKLLNKKNCIEKPINASKYIKPLVDALNAIGQIYTPDSLINIYDKEMKEIFNTLLPSKQNDLHSNEVVGNYLGIVSNYMLINPLLDGSLWFYHVMGAQLQDLKSEKDDSYFVFASMYLFYISENGNISNDLRSQIKKLANDVYKEPIKNILDNCKISDSNTYCKLLSSLLKYFKTIDNEYTWISMSNISSGEIIFNEFYIIAWWAGLMYTKYGSIDETILDNVNKVLNEDEKNYLLAILQYFNEIDSGNPNPNKLVVQVKKYFEEYGIEFFVSDEMINTINSIIEPLSSTLKRTTEQLNETLRPITEMIGNFLKQWPDEDGTIKAISDKVNNYPYYAGIYDADTDEKELKLYDYKGIYKKTEINEYINSFDSIITKFILDEASSSNLKTRNPQQFNTNFSLLRAILKAKTSNGTLSIQFGVNNNGSNDHTKESILFYARVVPNSICRILTSSEIDQIIDNDYILINGLYRPNNINQNGNNATYITKNELVDVISSNYRYISLHIEYKVSVDLENLNEDNSFTKKLTGAKSR